MSRSADPLKFWRCAGCGTPNPWVSYLATCVGCGSPRPRDANPAFGPDPAVAPYPSRPAPRRSPILSTLTWTCAAALLAVLAATRWIGESWWPTAALLYMPRAVWLAPVVALALVNLRRRSGMLALMHLAMAIVILGPLMGLNVPLGPARPTEGLTLRIMSINRGTEDVLGTRRLQDLIERERIDLICFQEGPRHPPFFGPELEDFFTDGWHLEQRGGIASRFPIEAELDPLPYDAPDASFVPAQVHRIDVRLPDGRPIRVVMAHLPTGRWTFQWAWEGDLARAQQHQDWRARQVRDVLTLAGEGTEAPILLAGDFNAPPDSQLLDPLRTVFRFAFEQAGWGYGYTRPTEFPWVKIDHILTSPEWVTARCWVGPDIGSDHLPVIAEVVLPAHVGP